ncbi:MAG: HAD-IIIC family phosphatase [Reyranella sp.]|uniref:HAD-IIIC family phosphatase n=1 Tax=Reyranella sp. TaxID=1929291 RepID=UPI001AC9731C|nr:HAD-IIIC family phosphatase [Reyranella sp.]MBN9088905.1 HAD-IIIC family phosphatase [Reyranella sp.]
MSQALSLEKPTAESRETAPARSVCLLSSANWDILLRRLSDTCSASAGVATKFEAPPFGQYRILLNDETSGLRRSTCDFYVFAERIEDFAGPFETLDASAIPSIRQKFADYVDDIRHARALLGGRFLVNNFAPVRPFASTIAEQTGAAMGIERLIAELNAELVAALADLPDTQVVPVSSIVADLGRQACDPGKYWLIGRVPFSRGFAEPYARLVAGIMMAQTGKTARALVIDLDNTLWGGVVGDDGMDNLKLGADHPGNQFLAVQGVLKALARRGILLTLVSKNTEAVALEAIREHGAMVLREKDFIAWRINWDPKSMNIDALARELDLSTASFLFVDDNPVERAEVGENVAGIAIPNLPADPSEWPRLLLAHPGLTTLALSAEDLNRARSYEVRRDIRSAGSRPGGREAFLHSLGLVLEMRKIDARTQLRINQLFAKTNQYNTTSRRYSERELKDLVANGDDVFAVRVIDKQGSDEIVGAIVVRYDGPTASVDNFVMSCRLLGRGVETAALSVVCERAAAHRCTTLAGAIIETPRNEPCRKLYSDHGFRAEGDGRFSLDLATPIARPAWFEIRT